jgi:hypothetical protein
MDWTSCGVFIRADVCVDSSIWARRRAIEAYCIRMRGVYTHMLPHQYIVTNALESHHSYR